MSDKKKSEQSKTDKPTSASSSIVDNQTGLSASIKVSSSKTKSSGTAENSEKPPASTQEAASEKSLDQTVEQAKAIAADIKSANKSTSNKNQDKSTTTVKNAAAIKASNARDKKKSKISKTAVLALIIALLAIAASVGHYFWIEQQKDQYSLQLNTDVQQQLAINQKKIAQQLLQNKQVIAQQVLQNSQANANELSALRNKLAQRDSLEKNTIKSIEQLQQQIASLAQNQPSDWLLQEAEYLIRVASRSLWLEKDTGTAISLLNDADLRIQELNDPQFFTLRQTIQQDIANLQLLPKLATDEVILKLMALDQQIQQLPLSILQIPENSKSEETLELSDNANDWRENLAKTWRKFSAEFFTITRRSGDVEPLMSAQFQQNLRENLSLKLQTAIWAASKANSAIYLQALNDIERWLHDYFDMSKIINQNFVHGIVSLKTATINVEYPNNLAALKAIRQILSQKEKPSAVIIEPKSPNESANVEQREGI